MPWYTSGAHFVHQESAKMGKLRERAARRRRIGRVSVYRHRRLWWVYYREHGQPIRKAVADDAKAEPRSTTGSKNPAAKSTRRRHARAESRPPLIGD